MHMQTIKAPAAIRADVLLAEVIRRHPKSDRAAHLRAFRKEILADDGADILDALISEYVSIKYNTARAHAFPVDVKQRLRELREAHEARTATEMRQITARLLAVVLPNGKALRDCTGIEAVECGEQFRKIGELAGERVIGTIPVEEIRACLAKP